MPDLQHLLLKTSFPSVTFVLKSYHIIYIVNHIIVFFVKFITFLSLFQAFPIFLLLPYRQLTRCLQGWSHFSRKYSRLSSGISRIFGSSFSPLCFHSSFEIFHQILRSNTTTSSNGSSKTCPLYSFRSYQSPADSVPGFRYVSYPPGSLL